MKFKGLILLSSILLLAGCENFLPPIFNSDSAAQGSKDSASQADDDPFNLDYINKKDTSVEFTIRAANNSAISKTSDEITISTADTYTISGYYNGLIKVTVDGCTLVLRNAYLEGDNGMAAIYYTPTEKKTGVTIYADANTENFVTSSDTTGSKQNAASIFSGRLLTFDGPGKLAVISGGQHAVKASGIKIKGSGDYYFKGSEEGSAINCNEYSHKEDIAAKVYLYSAKNGIKADKTIEILGGFYTLYSLKTGMKTDDPVYEDDGSTPAAYISIGSSATLKFHNVETQFKTMEGQLTNEGRIETF